MIKPIKDKTPFIVDFIDDSSQRVSGQLLTYEITGEACILMGSEKKWVPFSKLSKHSRDKVIHAESNIGEESIEIFKDSKLSMVIALAVLIAFFYCSTRFGA